MVSANQIEARLKMARPDRRQRKLQLLRDEGEGEETFRREPFSKRDSRVTLPANKFGLTLGFLPVVMAYVKTVLST